MTYAWSSALLQLLLIHCSHSAHIQPLAILHDGFSWSSPPLITTSMTLMGDPQMALIGCWLDNPFSPGKIEQELVADNTVV